ncbi:MAG TPA: sugar nucleotide-binding protein, partial [Solirubrobacteraceae bacterium]|nr:sugar nucleotide-binding protein [Solirubrobacteraceae bacterium]
MRLLVTGASGLLGSNVAAAAAQQSWSVLATWRTTPISLLGARTAQLDVGDRHACVALAEELEPDVVVHAGAVANPEAHTRDPHLAELELRGAEHTLAAARAVRARYALVSCEHVFGGLRRAGECWEEDDPTEPTTARGRSLLACEQLVRRHESGWLIARPAEVYGVN